MVGEKGYRNRSLAISDNDLETVILGCADTDERLINYPANFLAVSDILTFANINTNQWHSFRELDVDLEDTTVFIGRLRWKRR
jgi:hypothetical protein